LEEQGNWTDYGDSGVTQVWLERPLGSGVWWNKCYNKWFREYNVVSPDGSVQKKWTTKPIGEAPGEVLEVSHMALESGQPA
jgi:hypothetical protein